MIRALTHTVLLGVTLLAGLAHPPPSSAASDGGFGGAFSIDDLLKGSIATQAECVPESNSLWIVVDGKGECVRYFQAGLERSGENRLVHVWLHGDRLRPKWSSRIGQGKPAGNEPLNYQDREPRTLQAFVDQTFKSFGIPFVRLSRPGTYGSSGDHRERRRQREVSIVAAAIDALKSKYQVKTFLLSGHSGGGHLVGALLAQRLDLSCVVITSGMVSVAERVRLEGWNTDVTGYADFVDPIALVERVPKVLNRPILLVGDTRDTEVWFDSQHSYFMRLHRAGHRVFLLSAKAPGPEFHDLSYLGLNMVRWCAEGRSISDIVDSTKFITESIEPDRKRYGTKGVTAATKD